MHMVLWLLAASAWAGPEGSLGVSGATGTIGQVGVVAARARWASGVQLGARMEGSLARGWYLDGWEVRRGTAAAGVLGATLPLVRGTGLQLDVELDAGLRRLAAQDTDAAASEATVVMADVSPMATLPIGSSAAARMGWKQITHLQVAPSGALEAQGSLIRGALVWAPTPDLQVGLEGHVGGVFGFDGDGGKATAQAGALVRWVPAAARTYTNH